MMAARVAEAGEEWTKWRKEGMKVGGGPGAGDIMSSMMGSPLPRVIWDTSKRRAMDEEDIEDNNFRGSAEAIEPNAKRRKVNFEDDEPPMGVYEPHSGLVLC
jgi:chromatin structure-remodeling complex protein RSC7